MTANEQAAGDAANRLTKKIADARRLAEQCREWSREMERSATVVAPYSQEVAGGNRKLAQLLGSAADALLRAAQERNGMERERDACCDDYQKEAVRAHAAEQECDRLRAQRDALVTLVAEASDMLAMPAPEWEKRAEAAIRAAKENQ